MLKLVEKKNYHFIKLIITSLFLFGVIIQYSKYDAYGAEVPYFPVIGNVNFSNDYEASRSNGAHHATDIIAPKMSKIIAPVAGTITYVISPQESWGYSVGMKDSSGVEYKFIHMNNDTPGTDDGAGGEVNAYAPYMKVGNKVEKGQLIGYVGDSGNAETTVSHLHFEMFDSKGTVFNPYDHIIHWQHVGEPSLYPPLTNETLPFWVNSNAPLNVAMGDLDGDGRSETGVVAAADGTTQIKTYSNENTYLGEFYGFDPNFKGGGDVAFGDVNGDGKDEIVVVPGAGGGPWVRIYNSQTQLLGEFPAYDVNFKGGLKVTTGDVNGDGKSEIITGPGAGGGPWVRIFDAQGKMINEFAAYDAQFKGGIDVATADTVDTAAKEIITGPGAGGGPWVRIFKPTGENLKEFPVYDTNFLGGIRVSGGNVRTNSSKDEIMTIPASRGESRVRLMANSGANLTDYAYLEKWWRGGYDVAAGNSMSKIVTGGERRSSMVVGPR